MATEIDITRARRETRGCEGRIHFNNAGASLMPAPVADALRDYLGAEEMYGGYETADAREAALERFYTASAALLNCAPDEIAFVENATRAFDMAFYAFPFSPGDRILTAVAEYGSNVIAYLQQAERSGAVVEFVPNDDSGQVDVAALAEMLDERVKLVSMSHIPTGGGLVNPVAEVGKLTRAAGVPFLLDACQSVGQLPLDVAAIGCDVLCGTGRKYLRGPRGTGLLYVRREWLERLEPPVLDQHAATLLSPSTYAIRPDARRFETWEQNCAGKAALAVAIDYALDWGLEAIRDRVYRLAGRLRQALADVAGCTVTDEGREQCGLVSFVVDGLSADALKAALAREGISVSVSSGSGSLVSFERRGLREVVRASVHYFNSDEEIDTFVTALSTIVSRPIA